MKYYVEIVKMGGEIQKLHHDEDFFKVAKKQGEIVKKIKTGKMKDVKICRIANEENTL